MKTKHRTEITVETHRILVIHAGCPLAEGWSGRRRKHTARISLSAAIQAGVEP
jgi:hypothetical protein